jgi:hypothetical protein
MGLQIKRQHKDHLYQIALENGVSERLANSIVKAYIADLHDSILAGEDITVPGLFTIHVNPIKRMNGNVELELRGSVSSTIKKEVKGSNL